MKVLYAALSAVVSLREATNKVARIKELPVSSKIRMELVRKGIVKKHFEWQAEVIYDERSDVHHACTLMNAANTVPGWSTHYVSPIADDFMAGKNRYATRQVH